MNEIKEIFEILGLEVPLDESRSSFLNEHSLAIKELISHNSLSLDCLLYKDDNKLVLNELQKTLDGLIDFCYVDPPYNTQNSFIYDDKRVSENNNFLGSHHCWMEFMLIRLVLVKSLLKDDGIIAISIDDREQPYLRLLLDNIFGENQFIANVAVCRSKNGKGSNGNNIAVNHEYVLIYGKSEKSKILGFCNADESLYNKKDAYGKFKTDGLFRKKGDDSLREDRPNLYYPLYYDQNGNVFTEKKDTNLREVYPVDSKKIERRWLWGKEKASSESWKLYASKNGTIYVKNYFVPEKRRKIRTFWSDNKYLTERATKEIKQIYGCKIFDTPKPLGLIEDLIYSCCKNDALIIDFFAGTGTTAHAAYNLNRLDRGNRKVILVEKPQEISNSHIAFKKEFRFISDITEKRLDWIYEQDSSYKYHVIC